MNESAEGRGGSFVLCDAVLEKMRNLFIFATDGPESLCAKKKKKVGDSKTLKNKTELISR